MTDDEVLANAEKFRSSLIGHFDANLKTTAASSQSKIDDAYARATVLQAWRTYVLEGRLTKGALGFYSEAQNDALTSIVLVASGLWRPSLKSIRSLIENIIHCFYYVDHPVEYSRWEAGNYKPTFKSLFEYFDCHPLILEGRKAGLDPVPKLRGLYSSLSEAVHSSSKSLRMTDDALPSNIWKADTASIGKWNTFQKEAHREVNILLLVLLHDHIQGAAAKGLREALSYVVPSSKDGAIKSNLGVRITR